MGSLIQESAALRERPGKRMRNYDVLIHRPENAGPRAFQIVAESLHDANLLAAEVVANLSPEMIGMISLAGGGQGGGVEIVDVYEDVAGSHRLGLQRQAFQVRARSTVRRHGVLSMR